MIRNVFYKLGSLRSALAVGVGVPFLIAASAFAQVGSTGPSPAAPAATPANATGAGAIQDSAIAPGGAQAAGEASTERVVVTGSYIPTAETESALPVTVYTATNLLKQGAQTPAEGLRQLPSFVGGTTGQSENDANGGDGSAFINLRALGSGNTLILINGRRAFNFADVNAIPVGALSRSEVLKDGASAVYGSDAVAGVVNFILLNGPGEAPYQGAEIDFLYGNTTDTDSRILQTFVRGGVATDKVSVVAAAEYYDRDALYSRDRRISSTADTRTGGPLSLGGTNGGSDLFPGAVFDENFNQFVLINPSSVPTGTGLPDPADPTSPTTSYRKYGGDSSGDRFNFSAFTPSIPGIEKYQTYVAGRYKIFGEALQVYGDMLYSKRKQFNAIAPSPFLLFSGDFTNNQFNPVPDAQFGGVAYRLVQELANRNSFYDYDYFRYMVGFNGNFTFTGNNFISFLGYDTGIVYERGDFLRIDSGDARFSVLVDEINAGNFNPFIGVSAPPVGTAPTFVNGVPTSLTAPYDNVAAAQRASYIGRSVNQAADFLVDAKIFGNLFPNLYQGGIGFNLGYEQRHNRSKSIPDPVQVGGDPLGFNAAALNSFHQEVKSYFGELQIPLVTSPMNVPLVRSLDVGVAYRYEKFDNKDQFGVETEEGSGIFVKRKAKFNNNGDVRISMRYQPIQDITLRASYGESFLSPTPLQLFDPVQQNFPLIFDPNALNPDGTRGRTLQPFNGVQQGGNVDLRPETTDAYTAGLVVTPRFLPGFTATIDLYQLFTRNVILPAADFAQLALTQNGNFIVAGGNPADAPFADLIVRDRSGTVLSIDSRSANAGKRLVNGMDATASYQLPWTTFGTVTFSLGYNYFFTWKAEPVDGVGTHSFLGDFNNSTLPLAPGAIPYHKGFLRGEYEWKGFDFVATTNYISSFNDDGSAVNDVKGVPVELVGGTATDPQYNVYRRVSDYITLDMQLSYEFVKPEMPAAATAGYSKDAKDAKSAPMPVAGVENNGTFWQRMLWGTKIRVGVNNAFDRNPPSVLGSFNDNYDTSLYSIRNRYYYVGINKKF